MSFLVMSKWRFCCVPLVIVDLVLSAMTVFAQNGVSASSSGAGAKMPTFEVVSIRRNKSGRGLQLQFSGDGFESTDLPLQPVIVNAYDLRDPKLMMGGVGIAGAPKWIQSETYDIGAKISEMDLKELSKLSAEEQMARKRRMLQVMLEDRFKLKVHHVTQPGRCYALSQQKGGLRMRETKPTDRATPEGKMLAQIGSVTAQGVSMKQLAFALQGPLGCAVRDQTGLEARYDFELRYASEMGSGPIPPPPPPPGNGPQDTGMSNDASQPTLFTAIREQLGLRLIPVTVPVEGIAIDHIEKPSEN